MLPAATDLDTLDVVTVTATIPPSAQSFLTFSGNELRIENLEEELNQVIDLGSHVVDIRLDDGNGGSATYQITLEIQNAPNRDPEFAATLQTSHTIVKTNSPTSWSYTLPAATDLDTNDVITVSANIPPSASSFLTFDSINKKLEILELQDELNTAIPIGTYVVSIDLSDGYGGSASTSITLDIQEAPNQLPSFTTALETQTIQKTNSPQSWTYSLPAILDLDTNDTVSASANIPTEAVGFLTFDSV